MMKVVINYDFFMALQNVNTDFSMLKVARNSKRSLIISGGIWYMFDMSLYNGDYRKTFTLIPMQYALSMAFSYAAFASLGVDLFKQDAANKLAELSKTLNNEGMNISYDLLIKSEMYYRDNRINNIANIPTIVNNKYFYVKTRDDCEISMLQEHEVGTKDYVLTLAKPKDKKELILRKA